MATCTCPVVRIECHSPGHVTKTLMRTLANQLHAQVTRTIIGVRTDDVYGPHFSDCPTLINPGEGKDA